MSISWEGVAAVTSLGWQALAGVRAFWRRPLLAFVPFDSSRDLRTWQWNLPPAPSNRRVLCREVQNLGRRIALECNATLTLNSTPAGFTSGERIFHLHWADTESTASNSAPPISIRSGNRRLDIAYSEAGAGPGCWVAIPLALFGGKIAQAYLPPGRYDCTLTIEYGDGARLETKIALHSPVVWDQLTAD